MVGGEWLGISMTFDITFECGWQWVCAGMGIKWFGSGRCCGGVDYSRDGHGIGAGLISPMSVVHARG